MDMWIWRRIEGIRWRWRVRNEGLMRRVSEKREVLKMIRKRKINWQGHVMRGEGVLIITMERNVKGKRKKKVSNGG